MKTLAELEATAESIADFCETRKDQEAAEAAIKALVRELHGRISELEEEVAVDNKLLAERDRLLDAIPACSAHGDKCIPHAIEWVREQLARAPTAWTKDKPTVPGWWWVWQPERVFPCYGESYCVLVEPRRYPDHPPEEPQPLVAWVPKMDYADPLDLNTWDDALWMGPIQQPEAPKP